MTAEVWHVIGSRQYGGAEGFLRRLVRAQQAAGHTLAVGLRPSSPLLPLLRREQTPCFTLPFANSYDLVTLMRLQHRVHTYKPAIVQTYMGRATRLTRIPSTWPTGHVARLGGYYKIDGYYRHAHAWVGNTQGLCDYLVQQGLPAQRVFHIGNFVEPPRPVSAAEIRQLRQREQIPDDAWLIFTLGRFIDIKGFQDLLAAAAQLPPTLRDRPWRLVIGGDGPLAGPLQQQARQLGLEQVTLWPGWLTDAAAWWQAADLFVCPSRVETLGNVILEAWAAATPVLSTATAGARELITPEHNGLLCPVAVPASLAQQLQSLLTAGEGQLQELGQAGWQQLQQQHTTSAVVAAYQRLYATLRRN